MCTPILEPEQRAPINASRPPSKRNYTAPPYLIVHVSPHCQPWPAPRVVTTMQAPTKHVCPTTHHAPCYGYLSVYLALSFSVPVSASV